jgi:hypothetical protein
VYGPEKHKWDHLGWEHGFSSSERPWWQALSIFASLAIIGSHLWLQDPELRRRSHVGHLTESDIQLLALSMRKNPSASSLQSGHVHYSKMPVTWEREGFWTVKLAPAETLPKAIQSTIIGSNLDSPAPPIGIEPPEPPPIAPVFDSPS